MEQHNDTFHNGFLQQIAYAIWNRICIFFRGLCYQQIAYAMWNSILILIEKFKTQ